jgi:hypothetical protein
VTDAAADFTAIERTIVDWLEKSGHVVLEDDGEWILVGPKWPFLKQEVSVTALACAIHHALGTKNG